jgi:hypothetical protein
VLELSAAAKAVDHKPAAIAAVTAIGPERLPELWEPEVLPDLAGHGLVARVVTERPGKPATASVEYFHLVTESAEDGNIRRGAYHGTLVAMGVDERPAWPAWAAVVQTAQEPSRNDVLGWAAS